MSQTVKFVARDESPGTTPLVDGAVTGKVHVATSAGRLTVSDIVVYNPNAAVAYLQLYDAASTGAASAPKAVIPVPAGGTVALSLVLGWSLVLGLVYAASTAPTTQTSPASGLVLTLGYAVDPIH